MTKRTNVDPAPLVGRRFQYVGWRIMPDNSERRVLMKDCETVTVVSIDFLSGVGSCPVCYTVRFDDGLEEDCTRNCLRGECLPNSSAVFLDVEL